MMSLPSSNKNIVFIDVSLVKQNDNSVMTDNPNEDEPTTFINDNEKSEPTANENKTNTSPSMRRSEISLPTTNEKSVPTTTENEKNDSRDNQQQQQHHQQERNGSFKFSTTAYCGNCREELDEEFIGSSCRKCLKHTDQLNSEDDINTTKTDAKTYHQEELTDKDQQRKLQHYQENVSNNKLQQQQQQKLQIQIDEDPSGGFVAGSLDHPSPSKSVDMMAPSACGSINNENICRICLDNVDEGDLIAPCKCSGSTKYAHESCLLKWFFKSSKKSCEVCLGNVNVKPIGFKPVQEWRLPESGCDFIVYLFGLYFLIMVIFTGMITWIATQGCVAPVCVTLYTVCGVAIFYFFYCCGCVEYSRRYWKALLSVNKIWRIYGRADSLKNFKHHVKRVAGGGDSQQAGIAQNNKTECQAPYVINIEVPATITPIVGGACAILPNNNNNNNNMGIENVAMEIEDISPDKSIIQEKIL